MPSKYLSQLDGQEIFVAGPEEDEVKGDLQVFTEFEELQKHLLSKGPGIESEIRILHGIVTSANALPEDVNFRGVDTYILVDDDINVDRGLIITFDDTETADLAGIIEDLVASGGTIQGLSGQDIDNIRILYGYELTLGLSVDPDDIDSNKIQKGMTILDESKQLSTATECSEKEDLCQK